MESSYPSFEAEDLFDLDTNGFGVESDLMWDSGDSFFSHVSPSAPVHYDTPLVPGQFTHINPQSKNGKMRGTVIRGTGSEAAKTAQYLARDNRTSFIFCKMHRRYGFVSKTVLMSIITGILASCPDDSRPTPPDRSMKRAKGGLVAWLDAHQELALKYVEERCDSINPE
jgi:hypothetical protein